jgi:hypothetical protein
MDRHRRRRATTALLSSLILVGAVGTSSVAAPDVSEAPGDGVDPQVEAMLADDYELPLDEAAEHEEWQSSFLDLAHFAETQFGDTFAGAEQAADLSLTGEISFSGPVPTPVREEMARLGLDGSVTLSAWAGPPSEDTAHGAFEITSALIEVLGPDAGISTGFDVDEVRYVVELSVPGPELGPGESRTGTRAVQPSLDDTIASLAEDLGYDIVVEFVEGGPAEGFATLNGGGTLPR